MKARNLCLCIFLGWNLIGLSSCKEDHIRNKFAGAWEIEKITIIDYIDGMPASETVYSNCGTWAFVDNGMSEYIFNTSYLSMSQDIPCEFRWALVPFNDRWAGNIQWGPDARSDERILIENPDVDDGKSYNVEKIKRNRFVFYSFTQESQNADHIKQLQRFELKRTNQ